MGQYEASIVPGYNIPSVDSNILFYPLRTLGITHLDFVVRLQQIPGFKSLVESLVVVYCECNCRWES